MYVFRVSVQVHYISITRNKRCLLAYIVNRLRVLQETRWDIGAILPEEVAGKLSGHERDFFGDYNKGVLQYMQEIDLDLSSVRRLLCTSVVAHSYRFACITFSINPLFNIPCALFFRICILLKSSLLRFDALKTLVRLLPRKVLLSLKKTVSISLDDQT